MAHASAGRSGEAARWVASAALSAVLLGGCASVQVHRPPTARELQHVKAVEVEPTLSGARVELPRAARLANADAGRIRLGAETEDAILEGVATSFPCVTSLPLRRASGSEPSEATARLQVELASVALAAGEGPDPLAVLWVRFQTRVTLPWTNAEGRVLGRARLALGSSRILAADPRPRPLSEWLANDGALVRGAVAAISTRLGGRFVADLRSGGKPVDCARGGDEANASIAVTNVEQEPAAVAEAAPSAGPPPEVRVELRSKEPGDGVGLKALGAVGGLFVGGFVGAGYGVGKCFQGVGGSGELAALVVGACVVVAVPVGALVGTMVGSVKGVSLARGHVEEENARWRAEQARRTGELAAAVTPGELGAAIADGNRRAAGTEGAASVISGLRITLVEDGDERSATLELDLTLRSATGEKGRERRVCLRGPGPLPAVLWLDRETGLLRASIEAQLARAGERGALGLVPRPGDGPCRR